MSTLPAHVVREPPKLYFAGGEVRRNKGDEGQDAKNWRSHISQRLWGKPTKRTP